MKLLALALVALGSLTLVALAFLHAKEERGTARAAPEVPRAGPRSAASPEAPVLRSPDESSERTALAPTLERAVRAVSEEPSAIEPAESDEAEPGLSPHAGEILREYHANGRLSVLGHQVLTENGTWALEGPWEAWHENGTLHELGAYRMDREHGVWKWWYDNGVRMAEGRFDAGGRQGKWLFWHDNGELAVDGDYLDGEGTGRWVSYHENGVKNAEGDYADGKISGFWTIWREDGSVDPARTGWYEKGEKVRD